ncbi:MAG TPA: amidohydrolase family protein [Acidimicrobiales bacterium]|nr:amidohydrolase family protein [Acidimicrobiales bacterium]
MFIDADTHVDECEDTWSYFPKSREELRPGTMTFLEGSAPSYLRPGYHRAWFIDGQLFQRQVRSDERTGTTVEARELHDVRSRVKDMDELGVSHHVIYPTLFLNELTRRPELEIALCESYNRWLADRCSESDGRLQWVAVAPLSSIPDALAEIRRARDAGACGIFKRGIECGDRNVADPYFAPVYELAQGLDLPICLHSARPYRIVTDLMTRLQTGLESGLYVQDAFSRVLKSRLPERYPTLRIGFIEAGAGWLAHVLWSARADQSKDVALGAGSERAKERNREVLAEGRLFVTCEVSEDLPQIISEVGDASLIVGSDYGHPDRASVWGAHTRIVERPDIPATASDRLTRVNAAAFYGLATD